MAATELYRLALAADVPEDAWKTRLQWTTAFSGVAGLDDNFLHLSSAEQLPGTAEAHFAGKSDVMLLKFSVESMCEEADLEVRWEDIDGTKFPHVFGPIPYACLASAPTLLPLGADGKHVIPPLGAEAEAAAMKSAISQEDDGVYYSSEDDGYEGEAATGMYG